MTTATLVRSGRGGRPRPPSNQAYTDVISSVSREIPYERNGNNRTRTPQTLARGGSPPYTRTALSLRGAQRATRQSPGREDGRFVHEYPQTLASTVTVPYTNNYKNCRRSPLLTFPFREIPTVTPFPRNDKQYRRERRLIRTDVIKTNVHPYRIVIARSATRDAAISRKGRRTIRTRISSNTCQRWLTAVHRCHSGALVEKSTTVEAETIVHEYPQTLARGGSPPHMLTDNLQREVEKASKDRI